MKRIIIYLICFLVCGCESVDNKALKEKIKQLENELEAHKQKNRQTEKYLVYIDSLDYDAYSNRKWTNMYKFHSENILVHYSNGFETNKLNTHIDQMKSLFEFAPDSRMIDHVVKIGADEWTCVVGNIEGTFTKPMPVSNGKTIPANGKQFKLKIVVVSNWDKGKIVEKFVFFDDYSICKQLGISHIVLK